MIGLPFEEKVYVAIPVKRRENFLVADIGGTNTTFGVVQYNLQTKEYILLLTLHAKSILITSFLSFFNEVVTYVQQKYDFTFRAGCLAVAGPITQQGKYCKITHLPWDIHLNNLPITFPVSMINDFAALGYALNVPKSLQLHCVKEGKKENKAVKAVLGAGTFLGKAIVIWDEVQNAYIPLASEGGHASVAVQTEEEWELVAFLKRRYSWQHVVWGDVLSGDGLVKIYDFFAEKFKKEKLFTSPQAIMENITKDEGCRKTVALFVQLYARCARNFALDTLSLGGIYIAGGIAAKYPLLFQDDGFITEFTQSVKMKSILQQIPVSVITNYHASLYGAAWFAQTHSFSEE